MSSLVWAWPGPAKAVPASKTAAKTALFLRFCVFMGSTPSRIWPLSSGRRSKMTCQPNEVLTFGTLVTVGGRFYDCQMTLFLHMPRLSVIPQIPAVYVSY